MGTFDKSVNFDDEALYVNDKKILMTNHRDPAEADWGKLGIDFVIESTGVFTVRAALEKHLEGGAKKVLLTVPPKDDIDAMVVYKVNDEILEKNHKIISNASCTTNCLAPLAKVLDEAFGIEHGLMTTVHAFTNDQRLADVPTKTFAEAVLLPRILFQPRLVLPELLAKYCHNLQESWMEWPHGYQYQMVRWSTLSSS